MARCAKCSEQLDMGFTCNKCGQKLCRDHRLPEKHNCRGLQTDDRRSYHETNTDPGLLGYLLLPFYLLWMVVAGMFSLLLNPYVLGLLTVAGTAAVMTGAVAVPAAAPDLPDISSDGAETATTAESLQNNANGGGQVGEKQPTDTEYNPEKIEDEFIEMYNAERAERGLQQVEESPKLDSIASDHAAYMARNDYVGHIQKPGGGVQERFSDAGLLPECRISTGPNSYYPGAENAASAWWNRDVFEEWAKNDIHHADSNREVAEQLFRSWMNSRGHRKAMLTPGVDEVSLGLSRTNEGKIFAALEMC